MANRTFLGAALRATRSRSSAVARQPLRQGRNYGTEASNTSSAARGLLWGVVGAVAAGGAYYAYSQSRQTAAQQTDVPAKGYSAEPKTAAPPAELDYQQVYAAIAEILDAEDYDDGSYGPVLLRLAWHCSGTYDKETGSGGSNGSTMRFAPEANHGANAGLHHARNRLEAIKEQFPAITYSDLWTLAGVCAVQEMNGPKVPWRPGRQDGLVEHCTPDGRLPDGDKGSDHLRTIFNRQGFNDQEIVALSGAHALGRCHVDRSGFEGPWTFSPITFTNDYYKLLFDEKWQLRNWKGPIQYEDKSTKSLMMLTTDMALVTDKGFRKYAQQYAADQDVFFDAFGAAFAKMLENGVPAKNFKTERMLLKTSEEMVA